MKQFNISHAWVALTGFLMLYSASCSLNPLVKETNFVPASVEGAPEASSLEQVYKTLTFYSKFDGYFAIGELSTDLITVPSRGDGWYDAGIWLQNDLHTWTSTNTILGAAWSGINTTIYNSTLVAETTTGQVRAEGKFIRAFAGYLCCDVFGQVQHRPATAAVSAFPDVFTRSQAVDFVITELEEGVIPNLPLFNGANRATATKEAAKCLLAKACLNKAVYKQNPEHPEGPYNFTPADMNKVIRLCDEIVANSAIGFSVNYWDNFKWDNATRSKENIFVLSGTNGTTVGTISIITLNGNMSPGGWNGPCVLPKFYDSFEEGDIRKKYNIPGFTEYRGYNAGFLTGQQYGPPSGTEVPGPDFPVGPLKDKNGNPLIFTRDFNLYGSTDPMGIRYNKFPLSLTKTTSDNSYAISENDFPVFRYADVRLMKAEAILRGGSSSETPLSIINEIRRNRKASDLTSADLATVLAERGRELYCEGWRRSDQIRFGTYLKARLPGETKDGESYKLVLPIPDLPLSSNPRLKQNVGY